MSSYDHSNLFIIIADTNTKIFDEVNAAHEIEKDIQKRAPIVIKNMNQDHPDSLRAYVMAFGENTRCAKETMEAKLIAMDRYGLFLDVTLNDGTILSKIRVYYQGKVSSAKDLRTEAINMHRLAYFKLGIWYKIKNGYYQQLAKVSVLKACKEAKRKKFKILAIVIVIALFAAIVAIEIWRQNQNYIFNEFRKELKTMYLLVEDVKSEIKQIKNENKMLKENYESMVNKNIILGNDNILLKRDIKFLIDQNTMLKEHNHDLTYKVSDLRSSRSSEDSNVTSSEFFLPSRFVQ